MKNKNDKKGIKYTEQSLKRTKIVSLSIATIYIATMLISLLILIFSEGDVQHIIDIYKPFSFVMFLVLFIAGLGVMFYSATIDLDKPLGDEKETTYHDIGTYLLSMSIISSFCSIIIDAF